MRHAEGVYWTLLVELAFYALCIALLLTRSLFSARRIALLSAALALRARVRDVHDVAADADHEHPASFWPLNLSVMLWGALYRLDATAARRIASPRRCCAGSAVLRASAAAWRDAGDPFGSDEGKTAVPTVNARVVEAHLTDAAGRPVENVEQGMPIAITR